MTHIPGQIYLADQRGRVETAQQQRLSTFNFGAYQAEGRAPFGALLAFNEESLAPGQAVVLPVAQATHLLLLPVTGAVAFAGPAGLGGSTEVEQVQLLTLPAGTQVTLRNPYAEDVITLLHIWLAAPEPNTTPRAESFSYAFDCLHNQLAELVPRRAQQPVSLHLGCFQGRCEALYRPQPGSRLFAFVLAGAFELAGRLLHAHDGLALWDCPEADLEALSNDALVLLLELTEA